MRDSMGLQIKEFMQAVHEQALLQSDFLKRLNVDIQQAIGRFRPKLDHEGKVVYNDGGDPELVENTLDDMETALLALAARGGSRIHRVNPRFIARIARAATYARILERDTFAINPTDPNLPPLLRERVDEALAPLRVAHTQKQPTDTNEAEDFVPPAKVSLLRHPRELDMLRELIRRDILLVIKDVLPDMTRLSPGISATALKAMGAQGSGGTSFEENLNL